MSTLKATGWPEATQRIVKYAGAAGFLDSVVLGWVLHVQVGNGSPFEMFNDAVSPNRRFSHLWVSKTGHAEQYQNLAMQSWAQVSGNPSYWSVETEGFPTEPLTNAQLNTLANWHNFCGAADQVADLPGIRGIGTHSMGGANWGGHECPGVLRAGQRTEIIRRAQAIRAGHVFMLGRYLRRGCTGNDVKSLQHVIGCTADGIFGPITEEHVKIWQTTHHLTVDGIVGPQTARSMGWVWEG